MPYAHCVRFGLRPLIRVVRYVSENDRFRLLVQTLYETMPNDRRTLSASLYGQGHAPVCGSHLA
jgi:hypothetical protein